MKYNKVLLGYDSPKMVSKLEQALKQGLVRHLAETLLRLDIKRKFRPL